MYLTINEKSWWDSHVFQYSKYTKKPLRFICCFEQILVFYSVQYNNSSFHIVTWNYSKKRKCSLEVGTQVTSELKVPYWQLSHSKMMSKELWRRKEKFNSLMFQMLTFPSPMPKMQFNTFSITMGVFSNNLKQTWDMKSPPKIKLFFTNPKSATSIKTLNKQQTTVTCYQY